MYGCCLAGLTFVVSKPNQRQLRRETADLSFMSHYSVLLCQITLPAPLFSVPSNNPTLICGAHGLCLKSGRSLFLFASQNSLNVNKKVVGFCLDALTDDGKGIVRARFAKRAFLPPNASPMGDICNPGGFTALTGQELWTLSSIFHILFAPVFADADSLVSRVGCRQYGQGDRFREWESGMCDWLLSLHCRGVFLVAICRCGCCVPSSKYHGRQKKNKAQPPSHPHTEYHLAL